MLFLVIGSKAERLGCQTTRFFFLFFFFLQFLLSSYVYFTSVLAQPYPLSYQFSLSLPRVCMTGWASYLFIDPGQSLCAISGGGVGSQAPRAGCQTEQGG